MRQLGSTSTTTSNSSFFKYLISFIAGAIVCEMNVVWKHVSVLTTKNSARRSHKQQGATKGRASTTTKSDFDIVDFLSMDNKITMTTSSSSSSSGISTKSNYNNNNMTAVVHIGPQKTATSTIQNFIKSSYEELALDRYELGDTSMLNMKKLIKCFHIEPNKQQRQCNRVALQNIQYSIAKRKSNLLITGEYLSYTWNLNFTYMLQVLEPWSNNTIIVITYRRYYEWLISYWNQFNRYLPFAKRKTFVEYIKDKEWMDKLYYEGSYVYGIIPTWKRYFNNNVKLYNMHDIPKGVHSITEAFFCDAMPNAHHTCSKLRVEEEQLRQEKKEEQQHRALKVEGDSKKNDNSDTNKQVLIKNESPPLVYDDLVDAARQYFNIQTKPEMKDIKQISKNARIYQEEILQLKETDFNEYICPDEETLHWLLQRTLETERIYFPEFFHERGEHEIPSNFATDLQSYKLCTVNAAAVIQNNEVWQEFFAQQLLGIDLVQ